MAGFNGPEWQAGRAINALPPDQEIPEADYPQRDSLAATYRYLVSVGFKAGGNGPLIYRTVEVLSDNNLTPNQVIGLAQINALDILSGPAYQRASQGVPVVSIGDATIMWAATRG